MAPTLSPTELLAELRAIKASSPELITDPNLRAQICIAAKDAYLSLEQPEDVVARVFLSQPVEHTTVRIAIDLNLFTIFADTKTSCTLEHLVETTKADHVLLSRVLRSLASIGAVSEVGLGTYKLVPSYALFANSTFAKGLASCADFLDPVYQALPGHLASTDYQNPTDPCDTAVQRAFKCKGKDLQQILEERPTSAQGFGTLMSTWGEGSSLLQDVYDIQRLIDGFDSTNHEVMFVDVGGGFGQKAVSLKRSHPQLPGRFIVQDLPRMIENGLAEEGVEMMAHDFFAEQPVKGARAYYIRQCLHNWDASSCKRILERLRSAMTPGYSKLLIHELIMPQKGASTWVTTQDFNMMSVCATLERTEVQWREMLEEAGLKIIAVYPPADGVSEGVIEATVKD